MILGALEGITGAALEGIKSTTIDLPKFAEGIKANFISSLEEADRKLCEHKIYRDSDLKKEYINNRECYIREDIDYNQKDPFGRTNLERMKNGLSPINLDGEKVELHHKGQKMDAPLMELTTTEHRGQGNDTILHDKQKESEIDRTKFNNEKMNHWKDRAEKVEMRGIA